MGLAKSINRPSMDVPAIADHTAHLFKASDRIGHGAEHEGVGRGVEDVVAEGQVLSVGQDEVHVPSQALGSVSRPL
jgi:hypothetical protein